MDFCGMADEDVFALRDEVAAEAEKRTASAVLRNQTRALAAQAKALGHTQDEVTGVISRVMSEVWPPAPEPEPAPEPLPDAGPAPTDTTVTP